MRHQRLLSTILLLSLVLNGAFLPGAMASTTPLSTGHGSPLSPDVNPQMDSVAGVRLLSASSAGVVFEVRVAWEQVSLDPVTANGKDYVRVSLPEWQAATLAGAPALPVLSEAIGAPFGVGVTVRVTPGAAHTMVLPAPVLPAVTVRIEQDEPGRAAALPVLSRVVEEDAAVYDAHATYPQVFAKVTSDGVLRQQRVVGLSVYPLQYHPQTRELTVYETLRIEVAFAGAPAILRQLPPAESAVYETILQRQLLNGDSARAWRQPAADASLATASLPWTPPTPGWRIMVRADGFYKLTYAELNAAGLPVASLDPRTLRLYNLGGEAAIYVDGEADGRFGVNDYVLFYGQAIASKYTADNVYWLTYGQGTGLRMATRSSAPGAGATPAYYSAQQPMEQNQFYVPLTPGNENLERWLWDYLYPPSLPSWTHTFSLTAPYAGPATLTLTMLGYLQYPINPDHHVNIYLNGTQVDDVRWDGVAWHTAEAAIAPGLLLAGNNTISVVCPNDTGVGRDIVYIDRAELTFANTFVAAADVLAFAYDRAGAWTYRVDGFSSNQVAVYDVSNPAAVARLTGVAVASSASGYAARFQDVLSAPKAYWAMASTAYRAVQAIERDTASTLQNAANGADYILVTHPAFASAAAVLRDYRAAQGLRVMQVDVQDVYDQFGYGIVSAAAIHDFLAYAYSHWQSPAPSYVVLVGDGHYDPRDYTGYGRTSYIPPYLAPVDPWMGETSADNRYVTLAGADTLPDMMLGRLAVNSSAEASAIISKTLAYEQNPAAGDWSKQVLAVTDNADGGGNFAQMSDNLLNGYLPQLYQAQKVYYGVTHTTVAQARAAILAGINAGKLIVNFIGHADPLEWAAEGLFTTSDVAQLQNGGKLPVMLPMTCLDGYHIYPFPSSAGQDAMAEVVTRTAGRGAVASWSATGLGVAGGHDSLSRGFFEAVFSNGTRGLGVATAAGKLTLWATGSSLDLLDTYLLFGDPALRLNLAPSSFTLRSFSAMGRNAAVTLAWETASEIGIKGFNLYRAEAADGPRTKVNAGLIPSLVPPSSSNGAVYAYLDTPLTRGMRYFYWLEAVDIYSDKVLHGPVETKAEWAWSVKLPAILADR